MRLILPLHPLSDTARGRLSARCTASCVDAATYIAFVSQRAARESIGSAIVDRSTRSAASFDQDRSSDRRAARDRPTRHATGCGSSASTPTGSSSRADRPRRGTGRAHARARLDVAQITRTTTGRFGRPLQYRRCSAPGLRSPELSRVLVRALSDPPRLRSESNNMMQHRERASPPFGHEGMRLPAPLRQAERGARALGARRPQPLGDDPR
jgi:hypothetical protein